MGRGDGRLLGLFKGLGVGWLRLSPRFHLFASDAN